MPARQATLLSKIQGYSYSQIRNLTCSDISVKELRTLCEKTWGSSPCLWQIRIAFMVLKGETDVICVARTGAGKSLTFYLPLLVRKEGIVIIIVPLNALASEMAVKLATMGISAITLTAANSNCKNFNVSYSHSHPSSIQSTYFVIGHCTAGVLGHNHESQNIT